MLDIIELIHQNAIEEEVNFHRDVDVHWESIAEFTEAFESVEPCNGTHGSKFYLMGRI